MNKHTRSSHQGLIRLADVIPLMTSFIQYARRRHSRDVSIAHE